MGTGKAATPAPQKCFRAMGKVSPSPLSLISSQTSLSARRRLPYGNHAHDA